jgi:hypothetical protein
MRWFIRELCEWRIEADPDKRKLVTIFVVAQVCDWENKLWDWVPEEIESNSDLPRYLAELARSLGTMLTFPHGMNVPIWEREAVEAFKNADTRRDWVGIATGLLAIEYRLFPSTLLTQLVRCIDRCGLEHLVNAFSNLSQSIVAAQVADALTVEQRIRFATVSDNEYIEFAAIHQTTSSRNAPEELSLVEQVLLTELLLKVSTDGPRWVTWMRVFNAYPIRYPTSQVPLGRALADAAEPAIDAYVAEIILGMTPAKPDPARDRVAECLRVFQSGATLERRSYLWRRAHDRWSTWRFDQGNQSANLVEINWSNLDFAIVAYACECMSDVDREKIGETVWNELQQMEHQWHTSFVGAVTAWNRTLSYLQPFAHASHAIRNGEDWLPQTRTYLPFDPSHSQYLMAKYRLI